jgi:hypothetical protein
MIHVHKKWEIEMAMIGDLGELQGVAFFKDRFQINGWYFSRIGSRLMSSQCWWTVWVTNLIYQTVSSLGCLASIIKC